MSLILDALKKSEQERRRERGPDLQTIHQVTPLALPVRGKNLGWLVLLVVNVALLSVWWFQRPAAQPAAQVVAAPVGVSTASVESAPVASTPVEGAPTASASNAPVHEEVPQYTRIEPQAVVAQPQIAATVPIEEFADLPPDVRATLPAMTFSFHVYSENPQSRTIIINNVRLREGDEVSAGVRLERITEDGVVLAMEHHRIHVDVLTGW